MESVAWKDSLGVGNELMDLHHQTFLKMLEDARKLGAQNTKTLESIIDFLSEYTNMHFGAEEKLMKQVGYPEFANHKAAHDKFANELQGVKSSFDKDPSSISSEQVLSLMQGWFENHIRVDDKGYAPYVEDA